jgi:hypothetical protein
MNEWYGQNIVSAQIDDFRPEPITRVPGDHKQPRRIGQYCDLAQNVLPIPIWQTASADHDRHPIMT